MTTPRITLLALSLAGCSSTEGVWHLYLAWTPTPADACTTELTHNFTNLYTPEVEVTEDPWTQSTEEERSDAELFGTLSRSGEEFIFVVGSTIYEGTKQADGTHLFVADAYTWSSDSLSHSTGYVYRELSDAEEALSMRVVFDGKSLFTGTLETDAVELVTWEESDNWSQELAETEVGTTGDIPSYLYFLREVEGTVVPAYNQYDRADCTSDPCFITETSACSLSYDVVGHRTDLTRAEYDAVSAGSQGAGVQGL